MYTVDVNHFWIRFYLIERAVQAYNIMTESGAEYLQRNRASQISRALNIKLLLLIFL